MNISIIGLGNIGSSLAKNLTAGGNNVIVADQSREKAETLVGSLNGKAEVATIYDAIKNGDIIIFAVWFDVIKELLSKYQAELAGKIIVDPSNPIGPDGNGGFKKIIPEDQSSGQILATLIPADSKLVKAFGTLGAESLASSARRVPEPAVLFYATDDKGAGEVVARLIKTSGFDPVAVGGIDQSVRIEVGGELHEYGKLGRLVSVAEAASLV